MVKILWTHEAQTSQSVTNKRTDHAKPLSICFHHNIDVKWCKFLLCVTRIVTRWHKQHYLYSYRKQQICRLVCDVTANCGKKKLFIASTSKSLVILVTSAALAGAIHSQIAPFFALNCIFLSTNEKDLLKHNNHSRFQALFKVTHEIVGKRKITFATFWTTNQCQMNKKVIETKISCSWATEVYDFKLEVIKW